MFLCAQTCSNLLKPTKFNQVKLVQFRHKNCRHVLRHTILINLDSKNIFMRILLLTFQDKFAIKVEQEGSSNNAIQILEVMAFPYSSRLKTDLLVIQWKIIITIKICRFSHESLLMIFTLIVLFRKIENYFWLWLKFYMIIIDNIIN